MKAMVMAVVCLAVGCGSEFSAADRPEGAAGFGAAGAGTGGGAGAGAAGLGGQPPGPSIRCPRGNIEVRGVPTTTLDRLGVSVVADYLPRGTGRYVYVVDADLNGAALEGYVAEVTDIEGDRMRIDWILARFSDVTIGPKDVLRARPEYVVDGEPAQPIETSECWLSINGEQVAAWP